MVDNNGNKLIIVVVKLIFINFDVVVVIIDVIKGVKVIFKI